ncbi:hypothetical protein evm_012713 [Chilo suppressalis]|nr:hypothetical protein evm_012713 [Chilo suppressalis]
MVITNELLELETRDLIKQRFYNSYGASHDAFVWENSHFNNYLQTLHRSGESVWLLGDSGYPQRPWLMTPYG